MAMLVTSHNQMVIIIRFNRTGPALIFLKRTKNWGSPARISLFTRVFNHLPNGGFLKCGTLKSTIHFRLGISTISMAMTQDPIDWRYLPYVRPIFEAYFCGNIPTIHMAKHMVLTYLHALDPQIPIEL